MKSLKTTFLMIVCSLIMAAAPALAETNLGIALGGNWSNIYNQSGFTQTRDSGFGFAAGLSLTFGQSSVVGFRLAEDMIMVDATGTGRSYKGNIFATSAILPFNFNLGNNRHSLGIGAAYMHYSTPATTGSYGQLPTVTFVLDGKDMWEVGKEKYIFLAGRSFIGGANYIGLIFMLGYDF